MCDMTMKAHEIAGLGDGEGAAIKGLSIIDLRKTRSTLNFLDREGGPDDEVAHMLKRAALDIESLIAATEIIAQQG